MIKTTAINQSQKGTFSVIWDTGRRCNYDCTYCEATRHNNHSAHKSLEELEHTFKFIKDYTELYNSKRKAPVGTYINLTGGEPTANPNFWALIDMIKSNSDFGLGLTTNGAWSPKYSDRIIKNFNGVTVSYHAEAHPNLKKQVLDNIKLLHASGMWLQVNVMLHVDYFDECIQVYEELKALGINCSPRPIGDGAIVVKGWFVDSDGTNRRTSHEYTTEQQDWFFKQMGIDKKPEGNLEGNQLGRKCCASTPLIGKVDNEWQPIKLIDTHFEDWHCMVDWFFLYIDQETKDVFHHQTCRAFYGKTRSSLGNLDNSDAILDSLNARLTQPTIDHIVCPNQRCGCGMCIPKAKSLDDFKVLQESIINV